MMSVTHSIPSNITFGSLSSINKTPIHKDKDNNKCVIHCLKYANDENMNDDVCENITAADISLYISDQHYEIWGIMKRGDMVEDVISGRRFIVDRQYDQSLSIKIIRNGLTIRDMYTEIFDEGTIIPTFYSITEFPLRYFDNVIINNICNINYRPNICVSPSPISFDVDKLGLNEINNMYCELINSGHDILVFKLVEYEDIGYIIGIIRSNDIEGCGRDHYIIEYIEYMEDNIMFKPKYIHNNDKTFDKIIKKYNINYKNMVIV